MGDRRKPSKFPITKDDLQSVMSERGEECIQKIDKLGGIERICYDLYTSPEKGLKDSAVELEERKEIFGVNILEQKKAKTFCQLVWEAMQDTTLIILIVCAAISLLLSVLMPKEEGNNESSAEWIEGVGILISVVVVVLVTAGNDMSKEKKFRGLQQKMDKEILVSVIRNGEVQEIYVHELVVGDICLVKYGDAVPADGIILKCTDMEIDESALTGESAYVTKDTNNDPLLLSGTNVMEGSGKMVVVAVGQNSQAGMVYKLLLSSGVSDVNLTVLQVKLTRIAILIGYGGLCIAFLTVIIMLVQMVILQFVIRKDNMSWAHVNSIVRIFIVGITVLVVAVPEGLPLAVTLSLAYSVVKMMKDNNLVRQLHACETMGNATTICSDKTGTLTTNRMTVTQSYIGEMLRKITPAYSDIPMSIQHKLVQGISINCSYTSNISPPDVPGDLPKQIGNKTECALLAFVEALEQNYRIIRERHPQDKFVQVFTFNSKRKYMGTVIRSPKGYRLYVKGASEIVLEKCSFIYGRFSKVLQITDDVRNRIEQSVIESMACNGLRTILLAYRDFVRTRFESEPHETPFSGMINWADEDWVVNELTCLAIVGIEDPLRPEVHSSIEKCQAAGITVRMITGDNLSTATSIAIKAGIVHSGDSSLILTSKEFNKRIRDINGDIQQSLMDQVWPHLRVLARSTPIDKYNLVKGIMESEITANREVVAVTGDGTNDAPALKQADVGFAMGIAGTDVAKQASDIILTDDNFSSIVRAVLWGRNVYDNITKFLQFQLTVNVVAVTLAFIGACAVHTSVLRAVQMLWVNLVMDTLASLALATEAPTEELLYRMPYGRTKSLLSNIMMRNIIGQALYQLTVMFIILFAVEKFTSTPHGRNSTIPNTHFTFIFNSFVMMTLFNEILSRKVNGERNFFTGLFSNWMFLTIWATTFAAQVLIVQFGSVVMWVKPLPWDLWVWSLGFGLGTILWQQVVLSIPLPEDLNSLSMNEMDKLDLEARGLVEYYFPEFHKSPKNLVIWLKGLARYETQTRYPVVRHSIVSQSDRVKKREMTRQVADVTFF